ncbi:MAG: hypothetical protein DID90_2727553709 [Candidatus Nitrotoga sp. LAW]|nr:MAG: hypothetical protein DID90_2727553709 [Candidatus Nitrotoga sp. LAW]
MIIEQKMPFIISGTGHVKKQSEIIFMGKIPA